MTVTQRNIIAKGIFAVAVVTVTAVVGVVGYAQADRGGRTLASGYGGQGQLIREAVAKFRAAVDSAQDQLHTDIQACLTNFRAGDDSLRTSLKRDNDDAVSHLRSVAANPSLSTRTRSQVDNDLQKAEQQSERELQSSSDNFVATLDRNSRDRHQNAKELRQCLRTANTNFRDAVRAARNELNRTLHDILKDR